MNQSGSEPEQASAGEVNSEEEARKKFIQNCVNALSHIYQCRDPNCAFQSCAHMKYVARHVKICGIAFKDRGKCPLCKQFLTVCFHHAKHCLDTLCGVPLCPSIKEKLEIRQICSGVLKTVFK